MTERIVLEGELYLTLEAVAHCYQVEVTWLREAYELGLLGRGRRIDGGVAIAAARLDRVATIFRLHFHQGVNLPGIALVLGIDEEEP